MSSSDSEAQTKENALANGLEEIRLIVPKEIANQFRKVAKNSRISAAELFAEMVQTHAYGTD